VPHFGDLYASLRRSLRRQLEQIRRFIEETDIDVIDDEMREIGVKRWPCLMAKLPSWAGQ
jgi:hypothetical protein